MDGVKVKSYIPVYPSASTGSNRFAVDWRIVGSGDFNGDGQTDLCFFNSATGAITVWYMNGTALTSAAYISHGGDPNWVVSGVVDFNRDGHPDLLFQHKNTGVLSAWMLNNVTIGTKQYIVPQPGAAWKQVGLQ